MKNLAYLILAMIFSVASSNSKSTKNTRLNNFYRSDNLFPIPSISRFDRDIYDDLEEVTTPSHMKIKAPRPEVEKDPDEDLELEIKSSKVNSKTGKNSARICPESTSLLPGIDLSGILSIFGGSGISEGIGAIAFIIAVLWIKAVVIGFLVWIWWGGYYKGGKESGGENGYVSYEAPYMASSQYYAPVLPSTYGITDESVNNYAAPSPPVSTNYGAPPIKQNNYYSHSSTHKRSIEDENEETWTFLGQVKNILTSATQLYFDYNSKMKIS